EGPAVAGGVDGVARYAYALDLRDDGAYRLVGALLAQDIRLRAAFAPLVLPSADANDEPRRGVVLVPIAGQPLAADALHARIDTLARSLGVRVQALASGKSAAGIDLGSDSVRPI